MLAPVTVQKKSARPVFPEGLQTALRKHRSGRLNATESLYTTIRFLLPLLTGWRWLLRRADSRWYPTITLYRQHAQDQWKPVLKRLGKDLARRFGL